MENGYIDEVLAGDADVFRYFLKTYKDMAFNVAVSIVKDNHYAEEVVQDAFMKAFRGLKSFNRTATFKSWFYRIVVNEAFQKLRKQKRSLLQLDVDEVSISKISYEHEEAENNEVQKIQVAMKALPPNESLALNLFYLDENSLKEVGNITGWSASNTKTILHRARKNLRTILGVHSTGK